jgi:hypothetical protein
VLYYFNNVTDPNHDSGWQESSFYADSGLTPNTSYTYRYKVRDKSTQQNETQFTNVAIVKTPGSGGNIIANPGFETGDTKEWNKWGCDLAATSDQNHSGKYCAISQTRAQSWQGPVQDITGKVINGKTYQCSAWVRTVDSPDETISVFVNQTDSNGTNYYTIATGNAQNDHWTNLSGQFTLQISGTLQSLYVYIANPPAGVNFYVDDVVVKTDPDNCADVQQFGFGLIADLDHDCYVDFNDLGTFALHWLETNCGTNENCQGSDFEPDGDVDFDDLSDFCSMWLLCNDPQNPSRCIQN